MLPRMSRETSVWEKGGRSTAFWYCFVIPLFEKFPKDFWPIESLQTMDRGWRHRFAQVRRHLPRVSERWIWHSTRYGAAGPTTSKRLPPAYRPTPAAVSTVQCTFGSGSGSQWCGQWANIEWNGRKGTKRKYKLRRCERGNRWKTGGKQCELWRSTFWIFKI